MKQKNGSIHPPFQPRMSGFIIDRIKAGFSSKNIIMGLSYHNLFWMNGSLSWQDMLSFGISQFWARSSLSVINETPLFPSNADFYNQQ
jgi:hypothetical protein